MDSTELLRMVYWIMAGGGTALVTALLILGADHDVGHEMGVGHDFELEHELELGHDAAGGHAVSGEGPGPISTRTMLAFVGGWGWGGLIGLDGLHWGMLSLPFGAAIGFGMALLVFQFMKVLYNQEATSTVGVAHMVGQTGMVLTAIPSEGTGEVRVNVRGTTVKCLARTENGEPVPVGANITVVQEAGGTLVVRSA